MAILTGYIIKKLSTQNSKDFGRVKLQKMLHLVEYHCQLSSELKYQKNVAGPYAWELEHVIEPKLKSLRFFDIKKDKFGATSKVTYTTLSASNELSSLFNREFKDQAEGINNLLDKFQSKTWEFCEMISTMYAVWNNRLIRKELFTDEILKKDFLAWDDKKKRFIDQLDYALEWIRKEKIEPVGFGEYIDKK
jgi:type I restriction enzyme S subunit